MDEVPKFTYRTVCRRCGKDIDSLETSSCVVYVNITFPDGLTMPHVPYDPARDIGEIYPAEYRGPQQRCRNCLVAPGGIHHLDCPMERCPRCGGQLVECLRKGCKHTPSEEG